MKPDLYTKVVLTVIAACLVILVFKNFDVPKSAFAYGNGNVVDVRIVGIKKDKTLYSSGDWDSIPIYGGVDVYGSVDISGISAKNFKNSIPVTISETLPVKVENTIPVEVQNSSLPVDILNTQQVLPVYVTNLPETKSKKAK